MKKNALPGFTLIELMITIAIIAILSAIALPSYNNYIKKSRRADAQSALLECVQYLERQYSVNNTYSSLELPIDAISRVSSYYTLSFSEQKSQSYTIQAVPTTVQSGEQCGKMTISQTGARTPTTAGCWN